MGVGCRLAGESVSLEWALRVESLTFFPVLFVSCLLLCCWRCGCSVSFSCYHASILPRWTLISLEPWARINFLLLKLLLILVFYHTNRKVTNLSCTVFLWLSWLYTCMVVVNIASHLEDLNDISSWLKLGHTLYSGWSQKQHCILRSSSQTISYCFKRKPATRKNMFIWLIILKVGKSKIWQSYLVRSLLLMWLLQSHEGAYAILG